MSVSPELEIQSRYVLLASLAEDRRVLDLGGDLQSVITLAEAGPAELTIGSEQPDTLRAQLTDAETEGIEVVSSPRPPLLFDEDAFDLVVCHDLGELLLRDARWIGELRRVLAPDGYLVLALANPNGARLGDLAGDVAASGLSYEEAFEKLSDTFGTLTVFAQSPLVANLFYDLESTEEEPDLILDRSLLGEDLDEAGWYVLIFGPEAIHRDDLTIVQVPFTSLSNAVAGRGAEAQLRATGTEPAAADTSRQPLEEERAAVGRELEEERAALERRLQDEKRSLEKQAEQEKATLEGEKATLERQLEEQKAALERQLEEQKKAFAQQAEQEKAALEHRIAELEAQPAAGAPAPLDVAELDWLRRRVSELETVGDESRVEMLRQRVKQLKTERRVEQEKLNMVRERLLAAEAANDDAERVMPLMRERIQQLKLEQRRGQEKLNKIRERLLQVEAENGEAQRLLPRMRERIKQLKVQRRGEREKLNRARANLLTAEARLEAAVDELGSARADLETGRVDRARRAELEEQVTTLTAERAAAAAELDPLRQQIDALKASHADAEAKLAALRAEAAQRDAEPTEPKVGEAAMLRERIKQLKVDRRREQEKLLKVRERLLKLESAHDAIATEHRLLGQRVESLKLERQANRDKLAKLRENLLAVAAERETAVAEVQLLRERISALEADRGSEQTAMAELRDELQAQQRELQAARDETPLLRERVRSLLTSRADERRKVERLRCRVMELESRPAPDTREHEQALAALGGQLDEEHQRTATAMGRVLELEQEVSRHVQDKRSFESQIKDLLDEVNQLRDVSDASGDAEEALQREKAASEALRQELATLQSRVGSVEAENQDLSAEVQRLTDALHEHEMAAEQRTPPPPQPSIHEAGTVVAGDAPEADELTTEPPPAAIGTARDAVGRPIETSLEDIEDLIAGSVPPSPPRR